jgi:type I restriction-modification system DNA methylase subunit
LAPNLFYGTGIAASVLVLRQQKPVARAGKVLIVDASTLFKQGRNQNTLEDEHRQRIEELYEAFADEEGFARLADLDEIASNGFALNVSRYVAREDTKQSLGIAEATERLRTALAGAYASEDRLQELLRTEGVVDEQTVKVQ